MKRTRIAVVAVAAALGVGTIGVPSASAKWSKSACKSYVTSFHKKHPKPTKAQKSTANKTLKKNGCSQKV
jgi:hypothetical protein